MAGTPLLLGGGRFRGYGIEIAVDGDIVAAGSSRRRLTGSRCAQSCELWGFKGGAWDSCCSSVGTNEGAPLSGASHLGGESRQAELIDAQLILLAVFLVMVAHRFVLNDGSVLVDEASRDKVTRTSPVDAVV